MITAILAGVITFIIHKLINPLPLSVEIAAAMLCTLTLYILIGVFSRKSVLPVVNDLLDTPHRDK